MKLSNLMRTKSKSNRNEPNRIESNRIETNRTESNRKPEKSIRFIDVSLVYVSETDSYYTLEEYIDGDFVKWISII